MERKSAENHQRIFGTEVKKAEQIDMHRVKRTECYSKEPTAPRSATEAAKYAEQHKRIFGG